jgi:hypothetical protein
MYLRQGVHDESVEGEVDEPLVLGIEPELDDVGLGDLGSLELKVDVARDVKVAIVRGITILVLKKSDFTNCKVVDHNNVICLLVCMTKS